MNAANIQPYSRAVVKLLKGIVEKDDVVWNDLLDYQSEIQDYISVMGLELIVKKDETGAEHLVFGDGAEESETNA